MSILVVRLVPQGIVFAADRNITVTQSTGAALLSRGQTQRPKVLKWPNLDAIIGYVGEARIDGQQTEQWLYSFIGRNITFPDYATLATTLGEELQALMHEGRVESPLIIHLAGFEIDRDEWTPRIWFIHNTAGYEGVAPLRGTMFVWSEEISQPTYFGDATGNEIREHPYVKALFSFRQGYDLAAFGVIDEGLRTAMNTLVAGHPLKIHPVPTDLAEWEKHLRMAVLGYAAYFAAFYAPYEQFVGGGVDVVSVPWPEP